ncbi:MAG: flagellar motor switch protein FliG [Bacillota bacterium]
MSRLTVQKKAAAVIIGLGTDYASRIYKFLRENEVELLTMEIATMKELSPETMEGVMEEFYNLCLAQKYVSEGGIEYAKEILNKAFGVQNANNLIEKITKNIKTRAFDFLRKVEPKYLVSFLQNEHPQTIALVLSYLRAEQASEVLKELPRDFQIEVTERIATMERTSPEIVKEVEIAFEKKFSSLMSLGVSEIGGVKHMAEILNATDRGTEKFILEELGRIQPELTEEIRKRMFIFEDIVTLDPIYIQKILRGANTKDLLVALKGSSKEVAEVFYANMSERMAETMKEDAQYLRAVRVTDVEEAQQRLVELVRRLEETGEIIVARGRKDELIV